MDTSPREWIKCDFDGASKDNPGLVRAYTPSKTTRDASLDSIMNSLDLKQTVDQNSQL